MSPFLENLAIAAIILFNCGLYLGGMYLIKNNIYRNLTHTFHLVDSFELGLGIIIIIGSIFFSLFILGMSGIL